MTANHNFDGNDLLAVTVSYITSVWGQVALFGVDLIKAALLGLVGGAATFFIKRILDKHFPSDKSSQNR